MIRERTDRAVSEVIAFILVFSIVVGSVGLLYMGGFMAMNEFADGEQLRNSERAMDSLGENLNDISRTEGVKERAGELKLRDGVLSTGEESTNITVEAGGSTQLDLDDQELGALTYKLDSNQISYEGGAVFSSNERGGNVLISKPQMLCERDTAIVSVVIIDANQQEIQSSDGLQVRANQTHVNTTTENFASLTDVTITIDSPRYEDAWQKALEDNGWDWDASNNRATCGGPGATSRLVVRRTEIDVTI